MKLERSSIIQAPKIMAVKIMAVKIMAVNEKDGEAYMINLSFGIPVLQNEKQICQKKYILEYAT